MILLASIAAALAGAAAWTLAEYVLHRFDGHGMKGRTKFSELHLAHHARPDTFAPTSYKAATAVLVTVPMGLVGGWLAGVPGLAFTAGFVSMYLLYEWLHRRLHTHAALTGWGRWARMHHFQHHFTSPDLNHGVTSPLWDMAFGTWLRPDTVRIPRRHAPPWMVDADGELKPEYQGRYVLAGRARAKAVA